MLDATELERVAAISDPDTRAQHAIGRALVRLAAADACGCDPADVRVTVSESGKPTLPELPGLHVNVAHAHRAVVVASTSGGPIGVDIEHPAATVPQPRRLAQRLFASDEASTLSALPEDLLVDRFASVWTIKEAVGKALGVGIIPALEHVVVETGDIDPSSGGADLRLAAVGVGPPVEAWTLHQLVAPGGLEKIAVAVPAPGVGLEPVSVLSLEEFALAVGAQGATARRRAGSSRRRALR